MKNILNKEQRGFNGKTHILIACFLFQIIWILPMFQPKVQEIKNLGIICIVLFWGIVIGSALLPDLDNDISTAKFVLGILGKIISVFMVATSSMIYTVLHKREDKVPNSQHRMFWHSPFSCLLLFIIIKFFIPDSNSTVFQIVKYTIDNKQLPIQITSFIYTLATFMLVICSLYLFYNQIFYNLGKLFMKRLWNTMRTICILLSTVYIGYKMPISFLKFIGFALALGCLFHIIGDLFSLGSIPIIFPIPFKKKFWWKPYLPFQLNTGGIANSILDLLMAILVACMFYFMVKGFPI